MGQYSVVIYFVLSSLFFNLVMGNMFRHSRQLRHPRYSQIRPLTERFRVQCKGQVIIGGHTHLKDQQNQESNSHNYDELLSMVGEQEEMVEEEEEGDITLGDFLFHWVS